MEEVEKKVSIYYLIDQYNRIGYVGKADNMDKRLTGHKNMLKRSNRHIYCWIRSVGFENIKMVLIEECYFSIWQERESYWIAEYKKNGCKLTNHTSGGEGTSGFKPSVETRHKMSESRKGDKNSFFGRLHTDETKTKIAQKQIGNTYKKDKKASEETKNRQSVARKGKEPWNKGTKGKQISWNVGISITDEARQKMIETKRINKEKNSLAQKKAWILRKEKYGNSGKSKK